MEEKEEEVEGGVVRSTKRKLSRRLKGTGDEAKQEKAIREM